MSPSLFILAVFLGYIGEGGLAFFKEQTGRRYIKQAFSRYLSPDLVELLAADPSRLNLGGTTRCLTIMFCDIRGFTNLSERFSDDSEGLVRIMNQFFSAMTAVIMKHGGTVDKYIGDCIMAFWNAPLDDPDHASHACATALDMLQAVKRFNADLLQQAERDGARVLQLDVGIGINTGRCVVGNIGSDQRFDYSVLGDPVNIASRLEGQTKNYGTPIVIGRDTEKEVTAFAVVELDHLAVRGKTEAIKVFALMGGDDLDQKSSFRNFKDRHNQMLEAYRGKDWPLAKIALSECRTLAPELSTLYDLYENRIIAHESAIPDKGWNRASASKTK